MIVPDEVKATKIQKLETKQFKVACNDIGMSRDTLGWVDFRGGTPIIYVKENIGTNALLHEFGHVWDRIQHGTRPDTLEGSLCGELIAHKYAAKLAGREYMRLGWVIAEATRALEEFRTTPSCIMGILSKCFMLDKEDRHVIWWNLRGRLP